MKKIEHTESENRINYSFTIGDAIYEFSKYHCPFDDEEKIWEDFYTNTTPPKDISEAYLKIIRPKTHLFFKRIKYKVLKEYL